MDYQYFLFHINQAFLFFSRIKVIPERVRSIKTFVDDSITIHSKITSPIFDSGKSLFGSDITKNCKHLLSVSVKT